MIDKEYFRIHSWIIYHHGKALKCENELCNSVKPKRFEWALLKGNDYKKDRNNFIQLCPSCHRKYDYNETIRNKQSESAKGKVISDITKLKLSISMKGKNAKKIIMENEDGSIMNFNSIAEAVIYTGIKQSGISNALLGNSKSAGGKKWHYQQSN